MSNSNNLDSKQGQVEFIEKIKLMAKHPEMRDIIKKIIASKLKINS